MYSHPARSIGIDGWHRSQQLYDELAYVLTTVLMSEHHSVLFILAMCRVRMQMLQSSLANSRIDLRGKPGWPDHACFAVTNASYSPWCTSAATHKHLITHNRLVIFQGTC